MELVYCIGLLAETVYLNIALTNRYPQLTAFLSMLYGNFPLILD